MNPARGARDSGSCYSGPPGALYALPRRLVWRRCHRYTADDVLRRSVCVVAWLSGRDARARLSSRLPCRVVPSVGVWRRSAEQDDTSAVLSPGSCECRVGGGRWRPRRGRRSVGVEPPGSPHWSGALDRRPFGGELDDPALGGPTRALSSRPPGLAIRRSSRSAAPGWARLLTARWGRPSGWCRERSADRVVVWWEDDTVEPRWRPACCAEIWTRRRPSRRGRPDIHGGLASLSIGACDRRGAPYMSGRRASELDQGWGTVSVASWSWSQCSASIAAAQPLPAAVIAWR